MISEFLILSFILFLLCKYFRTKSLNNYSNIPSVPWKLPILGHLPYLGSLPHETFLKWKIKYGPMFFIHFGTKRALVINDGALIKAAFSLPSLSGRPDIKYLNELTLDRSGFTWNDGPIAKELRSFVQRKLKDTGFGRHSMEIKIQELIPNLLDIFENHLNKPLEIQHAFTSVTLNFLWCFINATEHFVNSKEFQKFANQLAEVALMPPILAISSIFIPQLATWFPRLTGYSKRKEIFKADADYVLKIVRKHEGVVDPKREKDFVDHFLDGKLTSPSIFTEKAITCSILELLTAGTDSSSVTLEWLIYYLVKYPEIQDKVQEEIDCRIGTNGKAGFHDRANLPFCEAVLNETLRITSVLPLALFHGAIEDTEFQGVRIKKGTMIIGNLYGAHRDPAVWEYPDLFKPERFLGHGEKMKDASSRLIPFSFGKRKCIGEFLARNQLFLLMVNIFQNYKLQSVGILPSDRGQPALTRICEPFSIKVSRRF